MSSIRGALRNGMVLATIATFAAAGIATERGVRRALLNDLDQSLRERALWVESTVELSAEGLDLGFREFALHEFEPHPRASLLQLFLPGDSVLYRSPSLGTSSLARPDLALGGHTLAIERTGDGRQVRTYRAHFAARMDPELEGSPPAPQILIALGRDMAEIETLLGRLRLLLAGVGLAAALLMLVFTRAVVRRSLRPVERIAGEIGALDTDRLQRRLDTPDVPLELEPVVRRLNDLLDRLHGSFERERTFSADIAHELRTPLAGLRTALEVELSRPRDAASYRETLQGSLGMLLPMQTLVETLLQLARLDAGLIAAETADTDLAAIARTAMEPLRERARARGLLLRTVLEQAAPLQADPTLLATAVRNILDNAVAHANEGTPVAIEVGLVGDHARLRVSNAAAGLTQAQVPRLFERFARGDDARGSAGGHYGLGLALVQRIAGAIGARVEIRVDPPGTFTCTLDVPRRPAGAAASRGPREANP